MNVEDLTGLELRELKEVLGQPFANALEEGDTDAMFAFVWISDRRGSPDLSFEDVLRRPFSEILAVFVTAQEADPTSGGSGAS